MVPSVIELTQLNGDPVFVMVNNIGMMRQVKAQEGMNGDDESKPGAIKGKGRPAMPEHTEIYISNLEVVRVRESVQVFLQHAEKFSNVLKVVRK